MFGVQYLNYHLIPASYQEGGASDAHLFTLVSWSTYFPLMFGVQYLN